MLFLPLRWCSRKNEGERQAELHDLTERVFPAFPRPRGHWGREQAARSARVDAAGEGRTLVVPGRRPHKSNRELGFPWRGEASPDPGREPAPPGRSRRGGSTQACVCLLCVFSQRAPDEEAKGKGPGSAGSLALGSGSWTHGTPHGRSSRRHRGQQAFPRGWQVTASRALQRGRRACSSLFVICR